MPHFGLMDPDALGPVEGALQRAKLHLRGGKRRLRQGKLSAGVVTLYDALFHAMLWYALSTQDKNILQIQEGENIYHEKTLFTILVRSGVISKQFNYDDFDDLVEKSLYEELGDFDYSKTLEDIEKIMTQLGVMPFEESALPLEDPGTY